MSDSQMVTIHADSRLRTLSFRYPRRADRSAFRRRIFEAIESEGFFRAGEEIRTESIFDRSHLGRMKADMEENCGSKLGEMTEHTRRRVTKAVFRAIVTFRKRRSDDSVVVMYCAANCYPCIGYELWEKSRPRLPAGFVEVCCNSRALRERITQRLRDITHAR